MDALDSTPELPARARETIASGTERLDSLATMDGTLWTVVILSSMLDVVTTALGLSLGLTEGNVVARAFLDAFGTAGIGLLKVAALSVLAWAWWLLDRSSARGGLVGFAVVTVPVSGYNLILLLTL